MKAPKFLFREAFVLARRSKNEKEHFDLLKSRAKINEILTDYLT